MSETENNIGIFPFEFLLQTRGKVKFTQLIQIGNNTWRGFNINSNLIMEIGIAPINEIMSIISIGIGENDYAKFRKFYGTGIFSMEQLFALLHWHAEQILEFDY